MNDELDFSLIKINDDLLRLVVFEIDASTKVKSIADIFEGPERFIMNELISIAHNAGFCQKWRLRKS